MCVLQSWHYNYLTCHDCKEITFDRWQRVLIAGAITYNVLMIFKVQTKSDLAENYQFEHHN